MTCGLMRAIVVSAALLAPAAATAQSFSVLVSPPRFEAAAKAGETYRNVIEITNVSGQSGHYTLHTADWTLGADGSAQFSDALAPGSCRPWVGIEAPEITVAANAKRRYRFEVAVPADAPVGECRFAILLDGDPTAASGSVPVPVAGRIGIIVYLTIGGAAPKLEVVDSLTGQIGGQRLPVLRVRNSGNAHGRLEGLIDGTDAAGKRYSFAPTTLPILPGETRDIALTPEADNDKSAVPQVGYPLVLKGGLDVGAQRLDIDAHIGK